MVRYGTGIWDFRIFIDAATLKEYMQATDTAGANPNFRIFIDAATLKAPRRLPDLCAPEQISASL